MSQIPAPLLSRHTAIAVVVVCLLAVAAGVATIVIPIDGTVLWLVVLRQVVLAIQCLVLALAMFLIWRTLAGHSFGTTIAALAAMGGFALLALVHLATIVISTPWASLFVVHILEAVAVLAAIPLIGGLLALGVSVLRHHLWHGPTRITLVAAAVLVIPIGLAQAFRVPVAYPYGLWSLVLIGVAVGLNSRREVPVFGLPDSQLGAAKV